MPIQETQQFPETKSKFFYGYIVVIAALSMRILMSGGRSSFGVFFKPMLNEFRWTRALISGSYSLSSIAQGLSGIVMGSLNDRLGPRVVMTLCGLLLGLGYLLMSQIHDTWQLYLFYSVIIGIGTGGAFTPLLSTVARWFVKRRSVMTAIAAAGGGIGGLIAPPVVNWLISIYGWRNTYVMIGVMVLLVVIFAAQFLKRDPTQKSQLPYGENKGQEHELNLNSKGLSLKESVYTKQFWMTVPMLFCIGLCGTTITVHIVPYATDLGISSSAAANILAAKSGAIIIGGIMLGSVADKIGDRHAYIICFIMMSAALFLLLISRGIWMVYISAIIMGFATGGGNSLESPLIAELFGIKSHGLILGVCSSCFLIGSAVGPFMAGYIYDIRGNYQLAFLVCATISVVGLILASTLRPTKEFDF
jgi:MFS family permease